VSRFSFVSERFAFRRMSADGLPGIFDTADRMTASNTGCGQSSLNMSRLSAYNEAICRDALRRRRENHMKNVYLVVEKHTVDGGFGDPIETREVKCAFSKKEDAEMFVKKWSIPLDYESEYESGEYYVEEVPIDTTDINKDPDSVFFEETQSADTAEMR
jgi:hypothetical protein